MGLNIFVFLLLMLLSCPLDGTPLSRRTPGVQDWTRKQDRNIHSIVGGDDAEPHSWPYIAYLMIADKSNTFSLCGGSILDESHVLTAAHCVSDKDATVKVMAGQHNTTVQEESEQIVEVQKRVIHPDYKAATYVNDIAVLKLTQRLQFSNKVKDIKFACNADCPMVNDTCEVAGWGTTSPDGTSAEVLQRAEMDVLSYSNCSINPFYGADQLCAYRRDKGPCRGDSGGPLVCECGGNKRLVGMVTYGFGCGEYDVPGYFARVSYFASWITQTMRSS